MIEITENDFNTFVISVPFGLIVFVSHSSHYTLDQKNHLVGTGDNIAMISIETLSEKTRLDYGIDHTPYWFGFKQQNFIIRQPGILKSDKIALLLSLVQNFDMARVFYETGETVR